jgi:hypothetical protein
MNSIKKKQSKAKTEFGTALSRTAFFSLTNQKTKGAEQVLNYQQES